jgi:hypothetical protein
MLTTYVFDNDPTLTVYTQWRLLSYQLLYYIQQRLVGSN